MLTEGDIQMLMNICKQQRREAKTGKAQGTRTTNFIPINRTGHLLGGSILFLCTPCLMLAALFQLSTIYCSKCSIRQLSGIWMPWALSHKAVIFIFTYLATCHYSNPEAPQICNKDLINLCNPVWWGHAQV